MDSQELRDDEEKEIQEKKKAVALKYNPQANMAPKVVAKGKGHVAENILAVAQKNAVPVYQNKSLVNMLMALELDKEIPALGGTTYVLGRAEDVHGGQHWVVLEGYSVNGFGQVQFDVNYTSANDKNFGRTYILGQPNENQTNTHRISKIETFTIY